jgi:hypothetical protein
MTIRNPKPISEGRDPDARNALAALKRASQNARELATRTNTPFVVVNSAKSHESISDEITLVEAARVGNPTTQVEVQKHFHA